MKAYKAQNKWVKEDLDNRLYNMMGKFAAIIGPAMMGLVGLAARHLLLEFGPGGMAPQAAAQLAARFSMASVVLLFVLGGGLFYLANRAR